MAASILFDIAGQIIQSLGSKALEEVALWWGVKDEIEKLKETVATIHAVLLDAEKKQEHNNQVKLWLGRLKDAMYDAEDLLDDFCTEGLQRQAMDGCRLAKEVRLFFSRSNQFAYGLKMGHKIKAIRERLAEINDNRNFHLDESVVEKGVMSGMRNPTDSSLPEIIIGRDAEKRSILQFVLDPNYEENVSVISIVGIGGMGKTALAQLIFNDGSVETYFDLKLWACVSEPFDITMIIRKILESANKGKQEDMQLNTLKEHIEENIRGKRYLLVLDDVWNEDYNKWLDLRKYLRSGAKGSKIIVTTRSLGVAETISKIQPLVLNGLSDNESWLLFTRLAFGEGGVARTPGLENIGKEIAKKCVGVPLAIKTLGGMLHSMKTEAQWLHFKDKELSKIDQSKDDIIPTLKLSYDHLPSSLKHCFAFCRLFPKGYEFCEETLIDHWIALGFVVSSDPSRSVGDVGLEYFRELLYRSFFKEAEGEFVRSFSTYKMHDLMHDLASSVGGSDCLLIEDENVVEISEKVRHVSFGFRVDPNSHILTQLSRASRLRTIMVPYGFKSGIMEKSSSDVLRSFRYLRSLDLTGIDFEELPMFIKRLKHLRYLDLSCNHRIKVLPNFITKLQNLQVLSLFKCASLRQLPKNIRKLKNLRHLDIQFCDNLGYMPLGLGQLTSLERLSQFAVAKDFSKHIQSSGLEELNSLNNLRGRLQISNLGYVKNAAEFRAASLKDKHFLESLRLDWNRSDNYDWGAVDCDFEERSLESLQPHPNLNYLYVGDYGGVRFLPSWFSSLTNLVSLEIVNCRNCQHLSPLHQLPSLRQLDIHHLSDLEYLDMDTECGGNKGEEGQESSSSILSTFFPSLEELTLLDCPKLKGWCKKWSDGTNATTADLPFFPCLTQLMIDNCPNLTLMPLFPSVNLIWLTKSSLEPLQQTMKMEIKTTSSSSPLVHPPLSKLKDFTLGGIANLESLPEEWLLNLTSLQNLQILSCPILKSLPQGMPQLSRLDISECPQLKERYGNKMCVNWLDIAAIPNIFIDKEQIQQNGQYLLDGGESSTKAAER